MLMRSQPCMHRLSSTCTAYVRSLHNYICGDRLTSTLGVCVDISSPRRLPLFVVALPSTILHSSLLYYSIQSLQFPLQQRAVLPKRARWRSNHRDLITTESGHVRTLALHHPLLLLPHHCNIVISIPIHLFEGHNRLFTAHEISERSVRVSMPIAHPC